MIDAAIIEITKQDDVTANIQLSKLPLVISRVTALTGILVG